MTENEQRAMAHLYLTTAALIDGDGTPRHRPRLEYFPPDQSAPADAWLPPLAALDPDGDYRPGQLGGVAGLGWAWSEVWEVIRGYLVEDAYLPEVTA